MKRILPFLLAFYGARAQEVVSRKAVGDFLEEAVWVPADQFGEGKVVKLARTFLASHPSARFAKLFISTDRSQARDIFSYSQSARGYVGFIAEFFRSSWASSLGLAEVIRIGDNTVIRVHVPGEGSRNSVLHGRDPLKGTTGHGAFEVVYVHFPAVPGPPAEIASPVFFVRADSTPSIKVCASIAEELKASTGLPAGSVRVRSDHWFITSPEVPVRYQFWDYETPPSPVEFIERPTALCGWGLRGP